MYELNLARTIFFNIFRRCLNISNKELQINSEIKDAEVRLINSDGSQVGVVPLSKAMSMAKESEMDLVKIADKANPPVCKIMNYGKYKFEMAKKEKESRKNQRVIDIKEVRLSVNIDTHDFETKVGHARKFANKGAKIKVSIRFRGREFGHSEIGYDIMKKFADACAEFADIGNPAKLEGRVMLMFLVPKFKPKK